MKNKLTAWICLLSLLCSLLTGCGTSTPVETAAPTTEPVVTTEPTTVPTEPKTFFEEQGFEFWEGFEVHETLDDSGNPAGGLTAFFNMPDSTECKVTITSGNQEVPRYRLADTKVDVVMDEYTLAEFYEACKNEKQLRTKNIKNASDNLYKAFKEEDSVLTKEAWLEQYRDYKVIHCQLNREIMTSHEVEQAKMAMRIGQGRWNYSTIFWLMTIMNCVDGMVYETISYSFPGVAEIFMLTSEKGTEIMAAVADFTSKSIKSGSASNHLVIEDVFVMVPVSYDDLAFVLPLTESERTLKDYEKDLLSEDAESPWEEKPYSESIKGEDHLKYYFLSPNHH